MSQPEKPKQPETPEKPEELRVGVFVCHCGLNIAGTVDVHAVAEYAKTIPDVVHLRGPRSRGNQESHQGTEA
jgi:heterodisulfide reductase subunit A